MTSPRFGRNIGGLHGALGVALVLALSPAALAEKSASDADVKATIKPPKGWVRIASAADHQVGLWREPRPKGFAQTVGLQEEETYMPLHQYELRFEPAIEKVYPGVRFLGAKEVTICKSQAAFRHVFIVTNAGLTVRIEQIITDVSGTKYVATYTRLPQQPDLPAALAALRSVCDTQPPEPTVE